MSTRVLIQIRRIGGGEARGRGLWRADARDLAGLSAPMDQRRQFARHPRPGIDVSGITARNSRGHVIDDVQDPEAAVNGKLAADKIQ